MNTTMNRKLRRPDPRAATRAAFDAAWQEYRMRNEYFDGEREIEAAAYERFRARWCQQNGHLIGSEDVPLHWRGSNPVEDRRDYHAMCDRLRAGGYVDPREVR